MNSRSIFTNEEVNLGHLPVLERTQFHPLEPNYKTVLQVSVLISWGVLFLAALIAIPQLNSNVLSSLRLTLAVLAGIIVLAIVHLSLVSLGFSKKGYAVREKDISFRTGLIMRRQTSIPYSRIQHVEVRQGALERYLKLGKLQIYTAGGQGSDLSVPGLQLQDARRLKAFILGTISADEEE